MARPALLAAAALVSSSFAAGGASMTGPSAAGPIHPKARQAPLHSKTNSVAPPASTFCAACPYQLSGQSCGERLQFLTGEYYLDEDVAVGMLLEGGWCVGLEGGASPENPADEADANPAEQENGESAADDDGQSGRCRNPSDGCNWWVNPLKAEGCATGPNVPPGRWDVYGTRLACCQSNFPNSVTCPVETSVVYYPASSEDEEFDVIPVRFEARRLGLGSGADGIGEEEEEEVKRQMQLIVKRILLWVSYGVPGLSISAVVPRSDEDEGRRSRTRERGRGLRRPPSRGLRKDDEGDTISAVYDVYVARESGREFGNLIIDELRATNEEVLRRVRSFPDTTYFAGSELELNWCTLDDEDEAYCVKEANDTLPSEAPGSALGAATTGPTEAATTAESGDEQGGIGLFVHAPADGASEEPPTTTVDLFAALPIQFVIDGLPDSIIAHFAPLRDAMLTIMKRNLIRVSTDIPGMIFVSIEEGRVELETSADGQGGVTVAATYDVTVIKEEGAEFGKRIVDAWGADYGEVVARIHSFGTTHIPADAALDWCTVEDDGTLFAHCARDAFLDAEGAPPPGTRGPTNAPSAAPTTAPVGSESATQSPSRAPVVSSGGESAAASIDSECAPPADGCGNGLFSRSTCECQCLRPYCPDPTHGRCTATGIDCGGNPWASCLRGVDCPWHVNPLKAESCTTGPYVPPGLWNVYHTLSECCAANHPHSSVCDAEDEVVYYPTIAPPVVHEAVPLRFDVDGLPESGQNQAADVRGEMRTVLDRVLEALEGRIPGLKIPYVEERAEPVLLADERVGTVSLAPLAGVSVYYTVYVVMEEGKDFGATIIDELRNSQEEVLEESAAFSGMAHLSDDLDFRWCTGGEYAYCAPLVGDSREQSSDVDASQLPSDTTAMDMAAQQTPSPTMSPTKPPPVPSASPVSNEPTASPSSRESTIADNSERPTADTASELNGASYQANRYYPNFASGICLNDGNQPLGVSDKYLFDSASSCCTAFFRANIQACLTAKTPTASPTAMGNRVFYPDYANNRCLDDGQQGQYEINLFISHERCCAFEFIDTRKCLQAMHATEEVDKGTSQWWPTLGGAHTRHNSGERAASVMASFFVSSLALFFV
ncbi:hypothetical protein ACHAXT_004217 [Thalassiosira profunda]